MGITNPYDRQTPAKNRPWQGLPFEVLIKKDKDRATWSIKFNAIEGEARLRFHEVYCSLYFRRKHQVEGVARQGMLGAVLEYRPNRRMPVEEFQVCPAGHEALDRLQQGYWTRVRVESLSPPPPIQEPPAPTPAPRAPPRESPEDAVRLLLEGIATSRQVGTTEIQVESSVAEDSLDAPSSPQDPTAVWASYDAGDTIEDEISPLRAADQTDPAVPLSLLLGQVAAALEDYVGLEEITAEVIPDEPSTG